MEEDQKDESIKGGDHKRKVEAVLFSSGKKVSLADIAKLCGIASLEVVESLVEELLEDYKKRGSPVLIIKEGDGYKMTVREKYLPVVQNINPHTELSRPLLETLAVIAWKSPVLQSLVVHIRSTKAYDHIPELLELGFITKEKFGRSFILKTTQKFNDYFDIPGKEGIKELFKDFKGLEGMSQDGTTPPLEVYELAEEKGGVQATLVDDKPLPKEQSSEESKDEEFFKTEEKEFEEKAKLAEEEPGDVPELVKEENEDKAEPDTAVKEQADSDAPAPTLKADTAVKEQADSDAPAPTPKADIAVKEQADSDAPAPTPKADTAVKEQADSEAPEQSEEIPDLSKFDEKDAKDADDNLSEGLQGREKELFNELSSGDEDKLTFDKEEGKKTEEENGSDESEDNIDALLDKKKKQEE